MQLTYGICLETIIKYTYSRLLLIDTVNYTKAYLLSRLGDL